MTKGYLMIAAIILYLYWRSTEMATVTPSAAGNPTTTSPLTFPTLIFRPPSAGNSPVAIGAPVRNRLYIAQ